MSRTNWVPVPVDIDNFGDSRRSAVSAQVFGFYAQALLMHVLESDQLDRDVPTPGESGARAYVELQAMSLRVCGVGAATLLLSGPIGRTITDAAVDYDAPAVLGSRFAEPSAWLVRCKFGHNCF